MVGYRKHGHNEVDEPSFTQPQMYQKIRSMESLPQSFAKKLVEQSIVSQEEVDSIISEIDQHFENEYQKSLSFEPKLKNTINPKYKGSRAMTHKWAGIQFSQDGSEPEQTGYDT